MIHNRRAFLTGLGTALIAAPAIVRVGSLMAMPRAPVWQVRGTIVRDLYYGPNPALPDILEWQRMMHEHIERVIRPPLMVGADQVRDHDRAAYDALMAIKPAGA